MFDEYKFDNVYKFANIITGMVDYETQFWNYDEMQLIDAICKFNKVSLLHIYIFTQLWNYYNRLYRKFGSDDGDEEYEEWVEIAKVYGVSFSIEYDEDVFDDFYDWFIQNKQSFEDLFDKITDEVFYILFADHSFLLKFNKIVSTLIKNVEGLRDFDFPEDKLDKNGTIKRCTIPKWVKDAVFHRDHGKCVFCGKDLTKQYTHSNIANYDHIIPLSKYGANDPCNIQLTCENCNLSKNDREDNPQYKYERWW